MKKILIIFLYFFILTSCSLSNPPDFEKVNNKEMIRIAFFGDQDIGKNSQEVLKLINSENTTIIINLGDFDYIDNPIKWEEQLNTYLDPNILYLGVIGNHDKKMWNSYQKILIEKIKNKNIICKGNYGVKSICKYKNISILFIAPGIENDNYSKYIKEDFSKEDNTWKICAWHKVQTLMQVGHKDNSVGWEVYDECRKQGAIIATAHEHSYSRTHLMSSFENQTVVSDSNILNISKGNTFAFVSGLGGKSIRTEKNNLGSNPWWGSVYTLDRNGKYGVLFCDFYINNATCYFKNIDGEIIDSFILRN